MQIKRRIRRRKRTAKNISNRSPTKCSLVTNRGVKKVVKVKHGNVKPVRNKIPARKSVRGFQTGTSLRKTKPSVILKETNGLVGKFVLPTRSVHSSRVIKPNKRFINMELSDSRTFKKRVISKRHLIKSDGENNKTGRSDGDKEYEKDKDTCKSPTRESAGLSFPQTPCSNGRVVLRQARLQLHSQASTGAEGPFSSNSSTTSSPPGTVTCGVCGAVRFYRFVKQARKFNIYSCESCRKFISKMIKRQTCGKSLSVPTLVCHKGQGMCHVPPIVRSQQWKLIRCAYRARCPACWLKMCLRSFQMPMTLKNSLAQLLPKNMQGPELLFNASLPLLSWQPNVESKIVNSTEKQTEICDNQRHTRLKSVKVVEKPVAPPVTSEIKRQKIDLKGPRVKHVCRSASIVLGQPLATFPAESESKRESEEVPKDEAKVQDTKDVEVKTSETLAEDVSTTNANTTQEPEEPVVKETTVFKQPATKLDALTAGLKREKSHKQSMLQAAYEVLMFFKINM